MRIEGPSLQEAIRRAFYAYYKSYETDGRSADILAHPDARRNSPFLARFAAAADAPADLN